MSSAWSTMNWRNVAGSILKGAAANQNLRKLELWMNKKYKKYAPKQEVIDNESQQSQAIETHCSLR